MKPYYQDELTTLYHGDCLEVMPALSTRCGALITDPPFAFTGGISNGRSSEISDQFFVHWWRSVCECVTALCGEDGCGFIWCDWKTAHAIAAGFTPRKQTYDYWRLAQMLFHYREMPGQGQPFRSSVDMIGYVRGPKHKDPPIANTTHNFISEYWYYGKHDYHPAEKSPSIAEKLVAWSGGDGVVLDPFAGSGTSLVAAKRSGRKSVGIEIEERFCEAAAERLRQEVLAFA